MKNKILCLFLLIFGLLSCITTVQLKEQNYTKGHEICHLPPETGPCDFKLPRWYYSSDGACKKFNYGGCKGNKNNFETEESCYERCQYADDICSVPMIAAACNEEDAVWYYNQTTDSCETFKYGECSSNKNNFDNFKSCQKRCVKSPPVRNIAPPDFCKLPPKTRRCGNSTRQWYHSSDGVCKTFLYGGCDGNRNRFDTIEECYQRCEDVQDVCTLPMVAGPCDEEIESWYYNHKTDTCEMFKYGGCKGNENRFNDLETCETTCKKNSLKEFCYLTPERGPCRASIPLWYYSNDGICKQFVYGGCQGNKNNFASASDCYAACGNSEDVCTLVVVKDYCLVANVTWWYYDQDTDTCEVSKNGYCPGSGNNFDDLESCVDRCQKTSGTTEMSPTEFCLLPPEHGPCNSSYLRWYFNNHGKCKRFTYGGCDGNKNNFKSLTECERTCEDVIPKYGNFTTEAPAEDACTIPVDIGPCSGTYVPWWYYNQRTDTCEMSEEGDCPLNGRTFTDFETCVNQCKETTSITEAFPIEFCHLPPHRGPCHSRFPRWYYSEDHGSCKTFIYGGCRGNENNFRSLTACNEMCGNITVTSEKPKIKAPLKDVCTIPVAVGSCPVEYDNWFYYNQTSDTCEKAKHGDCPESGNNFNELASCVKHCQKTTTLLQYTTAPTSTPNLEDACTSPVDIGPCSGTYVPWWYYNQRIDTCEMSKEGDCPLNGRTFTDLETCVNQCIETTSFTEAFSNEFCHLPPHRGPCHSRFRRWYYSEDHGSCKTFIYGGCRGNENNFRSLTACNEMCRNITVTSEKPKIKAPLKGFCKLRPVKGRCRGRFKRWFYNGYGACEQFVYGGCHGNRNNFRSLAKCYKTCVGIEDVCSLPVDIGPCQVANVSWWYYRQSTDTCEALDLGKCPINGNAFKSLKTCLRECKRTSITTKSPQEVTCQLPVEPGPCRAKVPRWHYITDDTCKPFFYGGCKGNGNNFETAADCYKACGKVEDVCTLPVANIPCLAGNVSWWYYDQATDTCEMSKYGVCPGSGNNFNALKSCVSECKKSPSHQDIRPTEFCRLPPKHGPCRSRFPRWYYSDDGKCKLFIYGGCKGNENNFKSVDECYQTCEKVPVSDVCDLPMAAGSCNEDFVSWYYNKTTHSCMQFKYSGCMGNGNRFDDLTSCRKQCMGIGRRVHRKKPCKLPAQPGPCNYGIARWYYAKDETCKEFTYGGCGGNENNFLSEIDCHETCGKVKDVCSLPLTIGSCQGTNITWYYDQATDMCHISPHGNCTGRGNSFEDADSCRKHCQKDPIHTDVPPKVFCRFEPEHGPCRSRFPRWYYSRDGTCRLFIYGGCKGNKNNFRSAGTCDRTCGKVIDACRQPKLIGECNEQIDSWFFNRTSSTCEQFEYSGCMGNRNRFKDLQHCEKHCIKTRRKYI